MTSEEALDRVDKLLDEFADSLDNRSIVRVMGELMSTSVDIFCAVGVDLDELIDFVRIRYAEAKKGLEEETEDTSP